MNAAREYVGVARQLAYQHRHRLAVVASALFALYVLLAALTPCPVLDRETATNIVNGCAFDNNILYIAEGSFHNPSIITEGPPRVTIPGVPVVPGYVVLRHGRFFFTETIRLEAVQTVRCVLRYTRR
jgi:hypothetical protein